jgi:hypothetical protein
MKHPTIISLTVALSIAACQDTTAPAQLTDSVAVLADVPQAALIDSSAFWTSLALEDAATRLLSGIDDNAVRRDLERSLRSLSQQLVLRSSGDLNGVHRNAAEAALTRLRALCDISAAPDLDAIAMALERSGRNR